MICPHLRRPCRLVTMAPTISGASAFGLVSGRGLSVGIGRHPPALSFSNHLEIVPLSTPKCRATTVIVHPSCLTFLTACIRPLGAFGFVVYAIFSRVHSGALQRY